MKVIDLYLGSDIGLWSLDQVPHDSVKNVLTFDNEITNYANSIGLNVLTGDVNTIEFDNAKVALSVHYPKLVSEQVIQRYGAIYNLHPGYLPWGRGFFPVFWALWENTPAGATLHEITSGIDTGPIVERIQVEYSTSDTGFTLYNRVRQAEKQIFRAFLPRILEEEGSLPSQIQEQGGSYHSKKEFFEVKAGLNWRTMSSEKLVHLIRCLSFPDHTGLEVKLGNQLFSLKAETLD